MRSRRTFLWPVIIVVLTLLPVLLLHKYRAAQKWDVVVFWTVVTFVPVIKLSQRRWETVEFWGEIGLLLAVHLTWRGIDRLLLRRILCITHTKPKQPISIQLCWSRT